MPTSKEIHKFPRNVDSFLKTKKTIRSIPGTAIISQRLKKIGDLAPNGRPIDIARAVLIKKGDLVPIEFRGIPGIKLGPNGIAATPYTDAWAQSNWTDGGSWKDSWNDRWDNSTSRTRLGDSVIIFNTLENKVKSFSLKEFTPAELKTISGFGI